MHCSQPLDCGSQAQTVQISRDGSQERRAGRPEPPRGLRGLAPYAEEAAAHERHAERQRLGVHLLLRRTAEQPEHGLVFHLAPPPKSKGMAWQPKKSPRNPVFAIEGGTFDAKSVSALVVSVFCCCVTLYQELWSMSYAVLLPDGALHTCTPPAIALTPLRAAGVG